ncbi:MAG: hypothetical protein QW478_07680 [Candidatus Micrarchaeaceae archaeon]
MVASEEELYHSSYIEGTNPPIFFKITGNEYLSLSIFSNHPVEEELPGWEWRTRGQYHGAYSDIYQILISRYLQKKKLPGEINGFKVSVHHDNDDLITVKVMEDSSPTEQFRSCAFLKLTNDEQYNKQILEAILKVVKS